MTSKNDYSHLLSSDNAYIDSMYETFKSNPQELDESWQLFFKGFQYKLDEHFSEDSQGTGAINDKELIKEFNVFRIVQAFRARGHLLSDTNPIRPRKDREARLELSEYGLEDADLDRKFICGEFLGLGRAKLRDILKHIKRIYCYKIAIS